MMKPTVIRTLVVCTLSLGLAAASALAPASADLRSQFDQTRRLGDWCANHETNIAKDYAANSDPSDDAGWAASDKALRHDDKSEQACDGHDDYVNAYLASWHAQILHHQGQDWKAKLDLANSLLDECATKNVGKDRGTQCAADLKANNQRAATWGAQ